ncbi:MAG: peptidoglycan-binding domain-containing protein [Coleofasciculus sp. G1-WW12-02]|uniref:peptidoglycan-binding domain-containing protein n=1 Tax=Coleofasciculus sp. G1-WW12-02 TaxID=3068483 RepID=UPI0032F4083B
MPENLWQDLAQKRIQAATSASGTATIFHPLYDDPCRLFAHYSTQSLSPDQVLSLGSMATPESLQRLRHSSFASLGVVSVISLASIGLAGAPVNGQVDGVYGPETREAVRTFQEDQGLFGDGIIGNQTWDAMTDFESEIGNELQGGESGFEETDNELRGGEADFEETDNELRGEESDFESETAPELGVE